MPSSWEFAAFRRQRNRIARGGAAIRRAYGAIRPLKFRHRWWRAGGLLIRRKIRRHLDALAPLAVLGGLVEHKNRLSTCALPLLWVDVVLPDSSVDVLDAKSML